jgi:hypothetical protein
MNRRKMMRSMLGFGAALLAGGGGLVAAGSAAMTGGHVALDMGAPETINFMDFSSLAHNAIGERAADVPWAIPGAAREEIRATYGISDLIVVRSTHPDDPEGTKIYAVHWHDGKQMQGWRLGINRIERQTNGTDLVYFKAEPNLSARAFLRNASVPLSRHNTVVITDVS